MSKHDRFKIILVQPDGIEQVVTTCRLKESAEKNVRRYKELIATGESDAIDVYWKAI